MRIRRAVLVLACATAALAWLPRSAGAQVGERIVSYGVTMAIQADGSVAVQEQIEYDFGSAQRHGIFRDVLVRQPYDDRYDRVYRVEDIAVTASEGTPAQFELEDQGSLLRVRIGDPDRTITGIHTYSIRYRVLGALNGFAEHDELYWNAIGAYWGVPIEHASVRVTGPAAFNGSACFAGPLGSTLSCQTSRVDGSEATFEQRPLLPNEGVTVVVGLPKGAVPSPHPILVERWTIARAFSVTPVTAGLSAALALLLGTGMGWLLWTNGRDRRAVGSAIEVAFAAERGDEQAVPLFESGAFPVEYVPPEDIRPGQVGTLIDEVANPLDVTATIIDLAVRGYLRIEEIPKRWFLGKPDWRLVWLKETDDQLLTYERVLLDGLFEDPDEDDEDDEASVAPPRPDQPAGGPIPAPPGLAHVKLSGLRKRFAARLKKVQESLYADAVKNRWFAGRPDTTRARWHAIGVAAVIGGGVLTGLVAWRTHFGLVALPLVLGGLVLLIGGKWMPRRTAKGTGMVRRVLGFRTYIATAEAQEARFQERENIFARYLPYAVVFGLTEKWARAFAGLDEQLANTSWYIGTQPFTTAAFAGSIDSFTVSTAGTITSTPGGSGGSGFSGGFSGGGGGGGGGGSW